jgi:hypothetical protein
MSSFELATALALALAICLPIITLTVGALVMHTLKEDPKEDRWIMMEQIILSGQMADKDIMQIMREDQEFETWLKRRAEQRQTTRH